LIKVNETVSQVAVIKLNLKPIALEFGEGTSFSKPTGNKLIEICTIKRNSMNTTNLKTTFI
jgi:hypothetical protein